MHDPIAIALTGVRALHDALRDPDIPLRELTEAEIATRAANFIQFIDDPGMRDAWDDLLRQQPVDELICQQPSTLQKPIAACSVMFFAHWLTRFGNNITHLLLTEAEERKRAKKLIGLMAPLIGTPRTEAMYFREEHAAGRCDQGEAWARAMEQIADYRERKLMEWLNPPLPIIPRIRGQRGARVYATLLLGETRRIYDQPLHGTVATLTTVALKLPESLEIEKVREWDRSAKRQRA